MMMKIKENIQGLGPQEPVNSQSGIGTPEPRVDEREVQGESVDIRHAVLAHRDRNKWNAQTRTAQSPSNLSSQCWATCTQPRTARFSTRSSNSSGERVMKSELSEAERTSQVATLAADTDAETVKTTP